MLNGIPDIAEDLTADWLTRALQATDILTTSYVTACEPIPFGEGVGFVSRIFRLAITYSSREPGAPETLVAKLHSKHPQNDRYWGAPGRNVYEKECRFYKQVAGDVNLKTPRCYLAETAWEKRRSLLLLEDLAQTRPGDQLAGCSGDDMVTIARDLARFNADFWESDALDRIEGIPDFTSGIESLQDRFDTAWPIYVEANRDHLPDLILEVGSRLLGGGAIAVRKKLDSSPTTLCHGDFRLDNLFFLDGRDSAESGIIVIDWTGLRKGPGMWDLSHAVCLGMDTEVRRASEHAFLSTYCETLAAEGIPGYTFEMATRDYRLSLLTHLQKLARSFGFEVVNDRHMRLREIQRTRVISSVMDHCTPNMIG